MPLQTLQQSDFAAGMYRSADRALIPDNAVYDALNVLLDSDGAAYRRGGSVYLSTADGTLAFKSPVETVDAGANVPLSNSDITIAAYFALFEVGVNLVHRDAVLLRNQTTGSQNGIYLVNLDYGATPGNYSYTLTRRSDADTSAEVVQNIAVVVQNGANAGTWRLSTANPITLGTTALTFALATTTMNGGLTFLWDGHLRPGPRTVFADPADFGVLSATEEVVKVGGAGLTAPKRAAEIGEVLVIGGGTLYGGSRKTASYTTGTIAVTNGSTTVTGTGTTWNTLVDAGMLFQRGAERYYVVKSIDSTTTLTLTEPYQGVTGSGAAYGLNVLGTAPRTSDIYAVAGDRLISVEGSKVYISNKRTNDGVLDWQTFDPDENYHQLSDGAVGIGAATVRDNLLVFASNGIWVIGNMAMDLTDDNGNIQHSVQHINRDVICWGNEGIASAENGVVVPATDGVYLVDGFGAPTNISRSITPLIVEYVRAGYRPGLATVYRSHYFLPVLNGNSFVDLLVCRLDRPTKARQGPIFPWTRMNGSGAKVSALANRIGSTTRSPKLLGAANVAESRVLDLSRFFEPAAAYKNDADNTTHEWSLTTKDYTTGTAFNRNVTRRMRIRYELVDAASDDPRISSAYSVGIQEADTPEWNDSTWNSFVWADAATADEAPLAGLAPEDTGRNPYAWVVNKRSRYIRFRLRSSDPAAKLVLRGLEATIRPSGKET